MTILYIFLFAFIIFLAFEIRNRLSTEEIEALKEKIDKLIDEVRRLSEEVKMKRNAYDEFTPPK